MSGRWKSLTLFSEWILVPALLAFAGCCAEPATPTVTTPSGELLEETWLQYRDDLVESTALVAQYLRTWEQQGHWPEPGTWDTEVLTFKGTESGTPAFPRRRRDFYRTRFAGGRELDVILHDDGRIEIDVFQDREPATTDK